MTQNSVLAHIRSLFVPIDQSVADKKCHKPLLHFIPSLYWCELLDTCTSFRTNVSQADVRYLRQTLDSRSLVVLAEQTNIISTDQNTSLQMRVLFYGRWVLGNSIRSDKRSVQLDGNLVCRSWATSQISNKPNRCWYAWSRLAVSSLLYVADVPVSHKHIIDKHCDLTFTSSGWSKNLACYLPYHKTDQ